MVRKSTLHIAHVSSQQELEAVIAAKKRGMNVTCEVTPHHLTFDETLPTRNRYWRMYEANTQKTRRYARFHMGQYSFRGYICKRAGAPHRISDKENSTLDKPVYGVTNHTVMLPVLLAAVKEGKITVEDVYQKLCVKPRERFNLPSDDGSKVTVAREPIDAQSLEGLANCQYGQNPWLKTQKQSKLIGRILTAIAGKSTFTAYGRSKVECTR